MEDDAEPLIPERLVRGAECLRSSLFLASDLTPLCVETPAWGFREEKEGEEEEEEEEKEADASLSTSSPSCPRSSSTAAVARFWFSL